VRPRSKCLPKPVSRAPAFWFPFPDAKGLLTFLFPFTYVSGFGTELPSPASFAGEGTASAPGVRVLKGLGVRFSIFALVVIGLFTFLSPELKSVSRETLAAETPTNAQVSEGLTCQCGCGLTVANCNMPTCSFSVPVRRDIDRMIASGMTRAQIIAFYRRKYGEKVLSAPTTEGFNLLAWTMPFIALALGGGLMVIAVGRWHSKPPSAPSEASGQPPPFDPELRRKLEKELKERR
jgi:cytochrome c-type biogenesis protein CcmH